MLHESLRELIVARGVEVVSDADEFRGALDDFLHEDEATVGELNLLVDAVRLGAVQRFLAVVDQGAEPAAAARDAGTTLARDRGTDDPTRSRWAVAAIGYALGKASAEVVTDLGDGGATHPVPPPAPAPAPTPAEPPPAEPPPVRITTADVPLTEPIPAPPPTPDEKQVAGRRGRGAMATLLAVVLVAAIAGAVWWWRTGDEESGGPDADEPASSDSADVDEPPAGIGEDELVLQLGRPDDTRLYKVNVTTGATSELTKGPQDRNPGLAPDRRSLVNLQGVDPGKVPYLLDLATGAEERLFPAGGPCARADRVAWSPDGSRLAAVCVSESNSSKGLYVADVTGEAPFEPQLIAGPGAKGTVTWVSDSAIIYQRIEGGGSSGLWLLDVDTGDEPERLTQPDGKYSGQPDYSPQNGLVLYLVNTVRTGPGELWVMQPDGSDQRLVGAGPIAFPVWSPDGAQIAFLGGPEFRDLMVASADDPARGVRVEIAESGVPGPPVWGSR